MSGTTYINPLAPTYKELLSLSFQLMIDTYNKNGVAEQRKLFTELMNNGIKTPVIIGRAYSDLSVEQLQLSASTDFGALLLDGLGDGIDEGLGDISGDQKLPGIVVAFGKLLNNNSLCSLLANNLFSVSTNFKFTSEYMLR